MLADVSALVREVYGTDLGTPPGVLHVTAVRKTSSGPYETLKINEHTPQSDHDTFALNLARARADAIVTTGRILREEPRLEHGFLGPPSWRHAFAEWRLGLGKSAPPTSLVLTSGRDLNLAHPLFGGPGPVVVYTTSESADSLPRTAAPGRVRFYGVEGPTVRGAIAYLRHELHLGTVSIEAGPSTTRALYDEPVTIDELCLSVFTGLVPDDVRGAPFLARDDLTRLFAFHSSPHRVTEASGEWVFQRFCRRERSPLPRRDGTHPNSRAQSKR